MIPVSIFLIVFLFFMLLVLLFTFFNVYHMVRYGKAGPTTIIITVIYLVVVLGLFLISMYLVSTADWTATIELIPDDTFPIYQ